MNPHARKSNKSRSSSSDNFLLGNLKLRPNYAATHVVILRAPRETMEALRSYGWHGGYWRDDVTGHDNGLRRIVTATDRAAKLRQWVDDLAHEAAALPGGVVTVWHPGITADDVQQVTTRKVIEIEADTVDEAVRQFKEGVR